MEELQNIIEPVANINAVDLYELLQQKGVKNFHHANTVKTSLSFIKEGALLSRQYVEQNALIQTEQYTDEKDKRLGIWDSVFLDGLDLHKKFWRRNKYGPILFHIDLGILKHPDFAKIRVTRSNPDSWLNDKRDFYDSIEGIEKDYLTGTRINDGRIMFVFDRPEREISLLKYCNRIVVDNPFITLINPDGSEKGAISEMVKTTIGNALTESGLGKIEIEIRHADRKLCACVSQYRGLFHSHRDTFNKLFAKG
jgi:hypothetical protein